MTLKRNRRIMRAVVTGGAGFLGSHLCDHLLELGYDVVCLDNLADREHRQYRAPARAILDSNTSSTTSPNTFSSMGRSMPFCISHPLHRRSIIWKCRFRR